MMGDGSCCFSGNTLCDFSPSFSVPLPLMQKLKLFLYLLLKKPLLTQGWFSLLLHQHEFTSSSILLTKFNLSSLVFSHEKLNFQVSYVLFYLHTICLFVCMYILIYSTICLTSAIFPDSIAIYDAIVNFCHCASQ